MMRKKTTNKDAVFVFDLSLGGAGGRELFIKCLSLHYTSFFWRPDWELIIQLIYLYRRSVKRSVMSDGVSCKAQVSEVLI